MQKAIDMSIYSVEWPIQFNKGMKHFTPQKTDESYGMENKHAVIAVPPSHLTTGPRNVCTPSCTDSFKFSLKNVHWPEFSI